MMVREELSGGIVLLRIDNGLAQASISLQGGQVLSWQPRDQAQPVLWLSPRARFEPGKAIRGGIPVCWPWFGAHPLQADRPAHGIARISPWQIASSRDSADGTTEICLRLDTDAPLQAELRIAVGATLTVALTTHNKSAQPCTLSEALHSYFHIGDIADIRVLGLEDGVYEDKVGSPARRRQTGPIHFVGEVDRVYLGTRSRCVIEDGRLQRRIGIDKSGSATTVVWSPGPVKAAALADLGADAWRGMVCVESGNAGEDSLTLAPGASHTLSQTCSVEPL